jgi:DNA-binding CsgD family transcriptional regulator
MAAGHMLLGRRSECEQLDQLLEAVRSDGSRVLVVRGEPGVGKSALLDYLVERASGCRVARAAGVQSQMELPFAGLHQLCAPWSDRPTSLPQPQSDALSVAFGLSAGQPPNSFLVGLGALGLLSEVAEERPLVCVVDDAQWLDRASAQALEFVAHRLLADSVALVFAVRTSAEELPFLGLPELVIEGLGNGDARALLGSVIRWPIDERVRDSFVAETRGNPLALLELSRGMTPAELAGGFGLPSTQALSGRIEETFRRRLALLPATTQRLLLIAAAEPLGDSALLWRAADRLRIAVEAVDAAEREGLVEFGARVTFRHPLVRSAIYGAASPDERREAHRALAEATDPELDPDRHVWHLAQATTGPDEGVASELELSASRAQARGGLAAAAAFLERSAALTLDRRWRAKRALAAARANAQGGAHDAAIRLVALAEAGHLDELERAQAHLLRGQIAFASHRGSDAPALLLGAARRLEPLDAGLARQTYLEALSTAMWIGVFMTGGSVGETAEAARAAPPASQPPRASDLLLDGLALLITEGHAAAAPTLKRALSAFSGPGVSAEEGQRWLWLAWQATQILWDAEARHELSIRGVQLARDAGALGVLPIALQQSAGLRLYEGDFDAADSLCDEARDIAAATGSALLGFIPLLVAAFRGREDEVSDLVESNTRDVMRRGEGLGLTFVPWATAVLYNGLARYQDALVAAQRAAANPDEWLFSMWAAVELIEAATRSGVPADGATALERLSNSTGPSGTDWALGVEARSRALLSQGPVAERLYRDALERLGRTRIRIDLARAHLLYGEWLRRERRRTDAREQLRAAYEMFETMGAAAFADRAERELLATGERARKRTVETRADLTVQEAQVARLARDGLSNPEIGARLFVSRRTVEYHLHKVFIKLGIASRSELANALPAEAGATVAV